MKIVAKMIVLPAKMNPAELHLMIGASNGACAITAGNAYALINSI
jgi:hypothetical protein